MKWKLFERKTIRVMLHIFAWIILLVLPVYFVRRWQIGEDFVWLYYVSTIISGIIFYTNYFFLVPKYFFENHRYRYYFSVALLLTFFYFISDQSNKFIFTNIGESDGKERPGPLPDRGRIHGPPLKSMHVFNYGFNSLFLIFFSLGLRVLERHSTIEKMQKELEKEKLNSELAFLKSQISPHFFFNTLNNIYSLISINAEDSRKAVLQLSRMMRYLLYESEKGDTKLSSEIEFMNNYIDLMRLRMSDTVSLKVEFPERYTDYNIPPLLFIPFIENAFKHGISFRERSFIELSLISGAEGILFRCLNSSPATVDNGEDESSGIGLGNVKKRLELLFPGKYELNIGKEESTFGIVLKIDMKT